MGVYYGLFDDLRKRRVFLGKAWEVSCWFEEHAPFTRDDVSVILFEYESDQQELLALASYCAEADWNVRLLSDSDNSHMFYEQPYVDEYGPWLAFVDGTGKTELRDLDRGP